MADQEPTVLEKERSALRKLWLTLALLGLLVSLNVLGATQGGAVKLSVKAAFGVDFDKNIPEAVAGLWGVVYLTIFVGLAGAALARHAALSGGGWTERYAFRLFELPTDRGLGQAAQALAIVVLTLAPGWFLAHSWKALLDHGVLCSEVADADWRDSGRGARSFFGGSDVALPSATRMTSNEKTAPGPAGEKPDAPRVCQKDGQTSYGAPYQSWIMGLFSLMAFGALARSLWMVFLGPRTTPSA